MTSIVLALRHLLNSGLYKQQSVVACVDALVMRQLKIDRFKMRALKCPIIVDSTLL